MPLVHLIDKGKPRVKSIKCKTLRGLDSAVRGREADLIIVDGEFDDALDKILQPVIMHTKGEIIYI